MHTAGADPGKIAAVDLNEVLKEGARSVGRRRGGRLSAVLVVMQFALTLVLLTGAGIFVHHSLQALHANRFLPGDKLLTARLDLPHDRYKDTAARQSFYDQLLPRLQTLPGVSHAAIVSNLPGLGAAHRDIEIEHAFISPGSAHPQASIIVQSPGYLDVIHLPLVLGRYGKCLLAGTRLQDGVSQATQIATDHLPQGFFIFSYQYGFRSSRLRIGLRRRSGGDGRASPHQWIPR